MNDPSLPNTEAAASPPSLPFLHDPVPSRPQFHGSGSEFFRIWIVNFFLTLVTLGFFIPWAKVRTRRYFYRQSRIGDESFDYLADPKRLLIGYLIVGIFFVLYTFGEYLSVWVVPAALILFTLIYPWIRWKSARFFAANSSYRHITFSFTGSLKEAYKIFLGFMILSILSLGLVYPWAAFRSRQYYFENFRFGNFQSGFRGRLGYFYGAYLIAFGVMAALLISATVVLTIGMVSTSTSLFDRSAEGQVEYIFPDEDDADEDALDTADTTDPLEEIEDAGFSPEDFDEMSDEEFEDQYDEFDDFDLESMMGGWMVGFFILFGLSYIGFFAGMAVLHVVLLNHCWSNAGFNTPQGPITFQSRIHPGRYIWIVFSNLLLCIVTLGIYIPFAKVRLHRYRLECLSIFDLRLADSVEGTERQNVGAIGESASDWLDFDFGL